MNPTTLLLSATVALYAKPGEGRRSGFGSLFRNCAHGLLHYFTRQKH